MKLIKNSRKSIKIHKNEKSRFYKIVELIKIYINEFFILNYFFNEIKIFERDIFQGNIYPSFGR